tara:strand:+ start:3420 stop:4037 length:618 start_codon:yes stop_codon:yes gene_type:complete
MIGGATTVHSGVVPSLQCSARLCAARHGSAGQGIAQAVQCTETFNHGSAMHGWALHDNAGQGIARRSNARKLSIKAWNGTAWPVKALPGKALQCTDTFNHGAALQCSAWFCMDLLRPAMLCFARLCNARKLSITAVLSNAEHGSARSGQAMFCSAMFGNARKLSTWIGTAWSCFVRHYIARRGAARKLKEKSCTNHYQIQTKESL